MAATRYREVVAKQEKIHVIYGSDLIKYKRHTDLIKDLAALIDPTGISVVTMMLPHRDAAEMRLVVLLKLVDREEPLDAILTVEWDYWEKVVQDIWVDTND